MAMDSVDYVQAEKLVSKSVFPEQANNNEWARYLYYTGRIKAIQLEYSEARRTMTNALRKAPQHTAVGFKQTVHKLLIVVELLLGEIPDRLQFRQPSLKRSLMPYFLLTQAVRTGNLAKFNQVLDQFGEKFQTDGTYTLIIRLRHNVIRREAEVTRFEKLPLNAELTGAQRHVRRRRALSVDVEPSLDDAQIRADRGHHSCQTAPGTHGKPVWCSQYPASLLRGASTP